MHLTKTKWRNRIIYSCALLWVAAYLRLTNLYHLPAYVDETIHLDWAFQFWFNLPNYPIWLDGRLYSPATQERVSVEAGAGEVIEDRARLLEFQIGP